MNRERKKLTAGDVTRIIDRVTELVDGGWSTEDLDAPQIPFRRMPATAAFLEGIRKASLILRDSEFVQAGNVIHAHRGHGQVDSIDMPRHDVQIPFEPGAKVGLQDAAGVALTLGFMAGRTVEDVLVNGNLLSPDPARRFLHGMRVLAPFTYNNEGGEARPTTFRHLLLAMDERGIDRRRLRLYAREGTIEQFRRYLRSRSTCCGDGVPPGPGFTPTPFGTPLIPCRSIEIVRTKKGAMTEVLCMPIGNVAWALAKNAWVRPRFRDDDLFLDLQFGFYAAFLDENAITRATRVAWPEEGDEDHDGQGRRRPTT